MWSVGHCLVYFLIFFILIIDIWLTFHNTDARIELIRKEYHISFIVYNNNQCKTSWKLPLVQHSYFQIPQCLKFLNPFPKLSNLRAEKTIRTMKLITLSPLINHVYEPFHCKSHILNLRRASPFSPHLIWMREMIHCGHTLHQIREVILPITHYQKLIMLMRS